MKRLFPVCLLILCLSFPVLAGHTVGGNWCRCGSIGCFCDEGEVATYMQSAGTVSDSRQGETSSSDDDFGVGTEALFALAFVLLWLRLRP